MKIHIEEKLKELFPHIQITCVKAQVQYKEFASDLSLKIKETCAELAQSNSTASIRELSTVLAARQAYKKLGKDPSRYRLSAEALLRRIVQGKGIYEINNLVDLLNLVSVQTGFSIGGYNSANIVGDIKLGIGQEGEPYQAIGRGALNITHLPILRDEEGAFGSPTSDSLRTMVDSSIEEFMMVFFNFDGNKQIDIAIELSKGLLEQYAEAKQIDVVTYGA